MTNRQHSWRQNAPKDITVATAEIHRQCFQLFQTGQSQLVIELAMGTLVMIIG